MIGASEAGIKALGPRISAPAAVLAAQASLMRNPFFDFLLGASGEKNIEKFAKDLDLTVGGGDFLREELRRAVERRKPPVF